MIADQISTGHGWAADLFFLVAVILAGLATIALAVARRSYARTDGSPRSVGVWSPLLAYAALAFVGLGLLVL